MKTSITYKSQLTQNRKKKLKIKVKTNIKIKFLPTALSINEKFTT